MLAYALIMQNIDYEGTTTQLLRVYLNKDLAEKVANRLNQLQRFRIEQDRGWEDKWVKYSRNFGLRPGETGPKLYAAYQDYLAKHPRPLIVDPNDEYLIEEVEVK